MTPVGPLRKPFRSLLLHLEARRERRNRACGGLSVAANTFAVRDFLVEHHDRARPCRDRVLELHPEEARATLKQRDRTLGKPAKSDASQPLVDAFGLGLGTSRSTAATCASTAPLPEYPSVV